MKRIFYITISDISVFHWNKHQLVHCQRYTTDEPGQIAFFHYLEKAPQITSYLLVDIVEEEFHSIQVPRMSKRNRDAYVERKLNSKFRATNYRLALYQGKSKAEPNRNQSNQDEILLTALTNPDLLSLFMSWMQRYQIPMQGIYSVPLISSKILKQLNINNKHSLLVSELSCGHIRQTFFHHQIVKSSRLSKLNNDDTTEFSQKIISEVQKNQRYLNRFHLLPKNEMLTVNIICGDRHHDALMQGLENTTSWEFNLIHIDTLTNAFKLKVPVNENQTEILFAYLMAQFRFSENHAKNNDRRYFLFKHANAAMLTASVLLGLSTLTYTSHQLLKIEGLQSQISLTKQRSQFLNHHFENIRRGMPQTYYTPSSMRQAVIVANKLKHTKFDIDTLYGLISQHLSEFKEINLQEISWESSFNKPGNPNTSNLANNDSPEPETEEIQTDLAIYRTVELKAKINNFKGDYISAFQTVKQFVNRLKSNKQIYSVAIKKLPIEINSKTVSAGSSGNQTQSIKTDFSVQLIFRSNLNEI